MKVQKTLSILTIVIGVILMIMMIVVEDEPGAIPLGLIVGGGAWYFITRARARSSREGGGESG